MYLRTLEILRCPECGPEAPLTCEPVAITADGEVLHGTLSCGACRRWFRIEHGIADLVRDGLREVEEDRRFLMQFRDVLPFAITDAGKPFCLFRDPPPPTEVDQRIIDEGRHWGRFMKRFWDVSDRSIFDVRVKGTHPSFFIAGVLEPDERDREREWGVYPVSTGRMIFPRLHLFAGKRGIDIGCGGGQFGLEAANQGVEMIGFDPSFEEVQLGREQARTSGVTNIDYVRAEPACPPFAHGVFDLVMAKDSLHHVPDLDMALERTIACAKPAATIVIHEHVAKARIKSRIMSRIAPAAVRKILRRWPSIPVPKELLTDSANEDVSAEAIRSAIHARCETLEETEELYLGNELEMYAHYAYGKRRWVSRIAYWIGAVIEPLLVALGDRQHWTFVGRLRG